MKQVIITSVPSNTVSLDRIDDEKFFGYESVNKERGIICQNDYEQGRFGIRSRKEFTNGNKFLIGQSDTLAGCIKDAVERGGKVYMFDTFKELMQFMIDEKE